MKKPNQRITPAPLLTAVTALGLSACASVQGSTKASTQELIEISFPKPTEMPPRPIEDYRESEYEALSPAEFVIWNYAFFESEQFLTGLRRKRYAWARLTKYRDSEAVLPDSEQFALDRFEEEARELRESDMSQIEKTLADLEAQRSQILLDLQPLSHEQDSDGAIFKILTDEVMRLTRWIETWDEKLTALQK